MLPRLSMLLIDPVLRPCGKARSDVTKMHVGSKMRLKLTEVFDWPVPLFFVCSAILLSFAGAMFAGDNVLSGFGMI